MDYYKVLGLSKNASKEEIKEAFRDLAKKFHPDKHSGSPKPVRDAAVLRFKQASEAYEVLVDDRKRSDYNLRYNHNSRHPGRTSGYGYGFGYADDSRRYSNSSSYDYSYSYYSSSSSSNRGGGGGVSRLQIAMGYLNSRAFLLHIVFAGILFGGLSVIDSSRDAIWKMRNSGKSFEEAIESIAKTKSFEEKEK